MNWVYMLRCGDGSLYTGWTNDIEHRVKMHEQGKGGKYTRAHLPVELVYTECYETSTEARSRDVRIKRLSRTEKLRLIERKEKGENAEN